MTGREKQNISMQICQNDYLFFSQGKVVLKVAMLLSAKVLIFHIHWKASPLFFWYQNRCGVEEVVFCFS